MGRHSGREEDIEEGGDREEYGMADNPRETAVFLTEVKNVLP